MLAVQAYKRRRAWAAWHAGYATTGNVKDADFADLLGRKPQSSAMPDEELVANIRRWRIAHSGRVDAPGEQGVT